MYLIWYAQWIFDFFLRIPYALIKKKNILYGNMW